jgi:hypothetical protein
MNLNLDLMLGADDAQPANGPGPGPGPAAVLDYGIQVFEEYGEGATPIPAGANHDTGIQVFEEVVEFSAVDELEAFEDDSPPD